MRFPKSKHFRWILFIYCTLFFLYLNFSLNTQKKKYCATVVHVHTKVSHKAKPGLWKIKSFWYSYTFACIACLVSFGDIYSNRASIHNGKKPHKTTHNRLVKHSYFFTHTHTSRRKAIAHVCTPSVSLLKLKNTSAHNIKKRKTDEGMAIRKMKSKFYFSLENIYLKKEKFPEAQQER